MITRRVREDRRRVDDPTAPDHDQARPVVVPGERIVPLAEERHRYAVRSRWIYAGVGLFMALAVLYGVDLVNSIGRVPRGTQVAGISVGGMKTEDAERKLVDTLGPRVDDPVDLRAGAVSTSLDPADVGLTVDWQGTLDRAGEQPLNPFVRFLSLFWSHEVGIASVIPDERLTEWLEKLALQADFRPREGAIWFDRDQVKSVIPMDGQKLQIEASREDVLVHWLDEGGVDLTVDYTPTETNADEVRSLVHDVAEPAAGMDVTLLASRLQEDGSEPPVSTVTLTPPPPVAGAEQAPSTPRVMPMVDRFGPYAVPVVFPRERIGEYLSFVRNGASLEPRWDADAAKGILEPELDATEQDGRDATFTFSGDTATVVPAVRGRTVAWGPLLADLPAQMASKEGDRLLPVAYKAREPELSTKDAENAGVRQRVGTFTVGVPAGGNARQMLAALNGHFIPGGGTFSMSEVAGTYSGDTGADGVATALFNAAYEAGAQSLQRTSRGRSDEEFPAGRDASASGDVSFRNGQRTALVIEAYGDGDSVTVALWGTAEYTVRTSTSPRSDIRPQTPRVVTDASCTPQEGEDGYTVRVTRTVLRGRATVSPDTFASTYPPVNGVECRSAPVRETPRAEETTTPAAPPPPQGIQIPGLPGIQIPGLTPPN